MLSQGISLLLHPVLLYLEALQIKSLLDVFVYVAYFFLFSIFFFFSNFLLKLFIVNLYYVKVLFNFLYLSGIVCALIMILLV